MFFLVEDYRFRRHRHFIARRNDHLQTMRTTMDDQPIGLDDTAVLRSTVVPGVEQVIEPTREVAIFHRLSPVRWIATELPSLLGHLEAAVGEHVRRRRSGF